MCLFDVRTNGNSPLNRAILTVPLIAPAAHPAR